MLGAKQMNQLLKYAQANNARVILVGDTRQIASIEAGKAFGQLQDAGMQCSILDHIVRQKNPQLLEAVESAAKGQMINALERVEQAGAIIEAQSDKNKMAEVISKAAQHYLSLDSTAREKTLVIATSRSARDALNSQIREGLKEQGVLQGPEVRLEALNSTGWTKAEMKQVANYNLQTQSKLTQADSLVVRFGRSYQSLEIEKGEYGRVVGIDENKGVVQLQMMKDGRTIEWDPARHTKVEIFESKRKELSSGDVVRWTRNCHELGLRNGETAKILDVQADGSARVELASGEVKELNLQSGHWDHGYAGTIFSAQGRTSESVIAIMPSNSPLSDQRSAYVAISRAKSEAYIYTDSKSELQSALQERTGEPSTALDTLDQNQDDKDKERQDEHSKQEPEHKFSRDESEIEQQKEVEKEKEMEWELELSF
jgi:ATP-dependent exoDNAse (exonuclease V) alpha subunit